MTLRTLRLFLICMGLAFGIAGANTRSTLLLGVGSSVLAVAFLGWKLFGRGSEARAEENEVDLGPFLYRHAGWFFAGGIVAVVSVLLWGRIQVETADESRRTAVEVMARTASLVERNEAHLRDVQLALSQKSPERSALLLEQIGARNEFLKIMLEERTPKVLEKQVIVCSPRSTARPEVENDQRIIADGAPHPIEMGIPSGSRVLAVTWVSEPRRTGGLGFPRREDPWLPALIEERSRTQLIFVVRRAEGDPQIVGLGLTADDADVPEYRVKVLCAYR